MRIVVKIGTSTLTHKTGRLNIRKIEDLCKILADIQNSGHQVVLVSSGAIGLGVGKLNLQDYPADMPTKQAAAAVGQCELMHIYDKLFEEHGHMVAQILLTSNDVANHYNKKNVENTLNKLLELGVIPIINENDTVAVNEIDELNVLGDNDTLSAIVAVSVNADLLVLLSDINGLYTSDPHVNQEAQLIQIVEEITEDVISKAGETSTNLGTGGMRTKLNAAKIVGENDIEMIIANGEHPQNLYDIIEGKLVGTRFLVK